MGKTVSKSGPPCRRSVLLLLLVLSYINESSKLANSPSFKKSWNSSLQNTGRNFGINCLYLHRVICFHLSHIDAPTQHNRNDSLRTITAAAMSGCTMWSRGQVAGRGDRQRRRSRWAAREVRRSRRGPGRASLESRREPKEVKPIPLHIERMVENVKKKMSHVLQCN
jgi:hypothetical protein